MSWKRKGDRCLSREDARIFAVIAPQTHKIGFELRDSVECLRQHVQIPIPHGYSDTRIHALLYEMESNIQC